MKLSGLLTLRVRNVGENTRVSVLAAFEVIADSNATQRIINMWLMFLNWMILKQILTSLSGFCRVLSNIRLLWKSDDNQRIPGKLRGGKGVAR